MLRGIGRLRSGGSAAAALTGYAIALPYGQSNVMYGNWKDNAIDVPDADIYQYGYNSPNANTIIAAAEPIDYYDQWPVSGNPGNVGGNYIGHDLAFLRDWYKANRAAGQKMMLAGWAAGGMFLATPSGGDLSANNPGPKYTEFITRAAGAKVAGGAGSQFAYVSYQQGEAEAQYYGAVSQPNVWEAYRGNLIYLADKIRDDLSAAALPFLVGQMTVYGIDALSARYALNGINIDRIHQEMKNYLPNVGFYGNGGTGTTDIHYTAAEHRYSGGLAGRMPAALTSAIASTRPASLWPQLDLPPGDFAVSNGGKDISGGAASAWKSVFATGGRRGEDVYFEFEAVTVNNASNMGIVGITNYWLTRQSYPGGGGSGVGTNLTSSGANSPQRNAMIWPATQPGIVNGWTATNPVLSGTFGNVTAGTRYGILVRPSLGKAWIRKVGSAWPFSGDPATGANPWISGITTTERIFPCVAIYTGAGNTWRLHTDANDLTGTDALAIPGVVAWGAP